MQDKQNKLQTDGEVMSASEKRKIAKEIEDAQSKEIKDPKKVSKKVEAKKTAVKKEKSKTSPKKTKKVSKK